MNKTKIEKQIVDVLNPIKITSYAFEKSNAISTSICNLAGRPLEVGFYLLGDFSKEDGAIIDDAYIWQEQTVVNVHCEITPHGKLSSMREIKRKGKKLLGSGHSHADMTTFYSDEDNATILKLVRQFGLNQNLSLTRELSRSKGYRVCCSEDGKGLEILVNGERILIESGMFDEHSADYLARQEFELSKTENVEVSFFYGMTFNAANDRPYCALAYILEGVAHKIGHLDYQIIDVDKNIAEEKEKIEVDLISRVIELKQQYSIVEQDIEQDFGELQSSYVVALSSLKTIGKGKKKDIQDEETKVRKVYDALQKGQKIKEKYSFTESNQQFEENSKVEEYRPKIEGYFGELVEKLSAHKDDFEKRVIELDEECAKTSRYKMKFKKSLINKREMYSGILEMLGKYEVHEVETKEAVDGCKK